MVSCRWLLAGKKAFSQLEESEKTLESKRKALQQAQEALEGATRKRAAAQEACASVEHEIEEEEDQDEEIHEEDQNDTRDPYIDWYNLSDCTSQSRQLKEMRTAISQISDTLALLLKTIHPVLVEVGTTVELPQTLALKTGATHVRKIQDLQVAITKLQQVKWSKDRDGFVLVVKVFGDTNCTRLEKKRQFTNHC